MLRVYVYGFYQLASKLQPLHRLEDGSPYKDWLFPLMSARSELDDLLDNTIVPVKVCRSVAKRLMQAIDAVVPNDFTAALKKSTDSPTLKLDWAAAYNIKESLKKFEVVLAEELRLVDTYSVTQKGAYSTSDLIGCAETLLPVSVRKVMAPDTVNDIREAGRCLAFETPTAAGFHVFRAIESVLLAYHQAVVKKPTPPKARNWGVYIKALRQSGNADQKIVDMLEHIKDSYRNPTTHPEVTMDIEDVLVLMGLAVSVIVQMTKAMGALTVAAAVAAPQALPPATP